MEERRIDADSDFDSRTLLFFLLERNIHAKYEVSYDLSARHN